MNTTILLKGATAVDSKEDSTVLTLPLEYEIDVSDLLIGDCYCFTVKTSDVYNWRSAIVQWSKKIKHRPHYQYCHVSVGNQWIRLLNPSIEVVEKYEDVIVEVTSREVYTRN